MDETDQTLALQDQLVAASGRGQCVFVRGGGSKPFYGRGVGAADVLDISGHIGIIDYQPSELMVRVRSGTPLTGLITRLAEERQMLAFEPPVYDAVSTVGGAIACGLSGPGRPWRGAIRDHLLGTSLLTGDGRHLVFGGQVMKNVAGYDVSRLLAGSLGVLGVILDVSLKVVPLPEREITLVQDLDKVAAYHVMRKLSRTNRPVTGMMHHDNLLAIRLSGSEAGVSMAAKNIGGEITEGDIWDRIKHQRLSILTGCDYLWRISAPPAHEAFLSESSVIDWGGAVRWLCDPPFNPLDYLPEGVHGTLFRRPDNYQGEVFTRPAPVVQEIHKNLKRTFDPAAVLNRGHLFSWL